jgi:hypothetical protein
VTLNEFNQIIDSLILISNGEQNVKLLIDLPPDIIEEIKTDLDNSEPLITMYNTIYKETLYLLKQLDKTNLEYVQIESTNVTTKPVYFEILNTDMNLLQYIEPVSLTSWIKEPKLRFMLPETRQYHKLSEELLNLFKHKKLDINKYEEGDIVKLINKFSTKSVKSIYLYANLPSENRQIKTQTDLTTFLAYNSFKGHLIKGIISPIGKTFYGLEENYQFSIRTDYFQNCLNVLMLLMNLEKNKIKGYLDLEVHNFFSNNEVITLKQLLDEIYKQSFEDVFLYKMLSMPLHIIKKMLNLDVDLWDINEGFYHTYIKKQKLVGNRWMGKGLILVNFSSTKRMLLHLDDINVVNVTYQGPFDVFTSIESAYLNFVLNINMIPNINYHMLLNEGIFWNDTFFGVDSVGSLCVKTARYLNRYIPTITHEVLDIKLKDLSLFNLKHLKGRYVAERSIENEGSFIFMLEQHPIQTDEIVGRLSTIILNSRYNKNLISAYSDDISKFLNLYHLINAPVSMHISFDKFKNNFGGTMIYKIMSESVIENPIKLNANAPTEVAPVGGMLNMLINYKKKHEDFDLNIDAHFSRIYMNFRSANPEGFMALFEEQKKKIYDLTLTDLERAVLKKEIIKLSKMFNEEDENFNKNLIGILQHWGKLNLIGGMVDMVCEPDEISFSIFRIGGANAIFQNNYHAIWDEVFIHLINSIVDSNVNYQDFKNSYNINTKDGVLKCINTYLLQVIHSRYNSFFDNNINMNIGLHFLVELFNFLFRDKFFLAKFQKNIDANYLISLLPARSEFTNNWIIMINTLSNYKQNTIMSNERPKFTEKISRDITLPSVLVNAILRKTKSKENIQAPYFSFLTQKWFQNLNNQKTFVYNNKKYNIKFRINDQVQTRVHFNSVVEYKYKLNEQIESDEFEEHYLETTMADPDPDSIISTFESLGFCYATSHGINLTANQVNLSFDILIRIGQLNNQSKMDTVRQAGNNLLIITDCISKYIISINWKAKYFQPMNWNLNNGYNSSLLVLIVLSPIDIPNQLIEQLFSCGSIHVGELSKRLLKTPFQYYYDELGSLNDKNVYLNADVSEKFVIEASQHLHHVDKVSEKIDSSIEKILSEKTIKPKEDIEDPFDAYRKNLEKIGVSEVSSSKIIKKLENAGKEVNLTDLITKLLTKGEGLSRLSEIMGGAIKNTQGEVLNKILNFPEIYAKGDLTSNLMKKTYIDNRLSADLNCFSQGLTELVLSGNLLITAKEKALLIKNIRLWEKYIKGNKRESVKKTLLAILKLLLNDAFITDKKQSLWQNITDLFTDFMVDDDESSEDTEETTTTDLPLNDLTTIYLVN